MDFSAGHGYLLIGGLILVGAGLLIISLIVNLRVALSVRDDVRYREKLLEYYRNIFSQLGVILIGIGVSLFIFFFQQNYQDQRRRETDLQQVLAKLAGRIARGVPVVASLDEFDEVLDDGGAYVSPDLGGKNAAVSAQGSELGKQVAKILLVERDIDVRDFDILNLSRDFETTFVVNEIDPKLWFNIVRDESEIKYATTQLVLDYKDLEDAIGGEPVEAAVANPEKERKIKHEVLDIFYDADLLRLRSRQFLGRACWLFGKGRGFVSAAAADAIEADARSHQEWIDRVKPLLTQAKSGSGDCFKLLHYGGVAE
ncbi:hypothetical protein EN836_30875 [Mesorhizobium sp. M1C.F.Ca.ET.193.01.1.1]|uniref:hypothetical protein n=1 Tax=unclassified Mesorhizobium TaxID=325217 RepID=UPI000FD1D2FC|nr:MULTISPECIES: hypothetical protein [unclassified Mesorhizobium]TGS91965.1 hypothetical protein EN820_51535 [bacterium M00.F.Ca.ET.177.01.1.1]TGQ50055.1 hypothetical protein EN853_30865 [Mesorhizobium sp. M1C.F.Ca.ET.210.01.1.1]TGQ64749.1 hypothetical protein EN855_030880 [Mesorhizobium sp. M1C.F.Ca.ET.212.01.1.1]TGQ98365.1 hypothetical protein EN847_30865 [Mesorhizobium sp. M1C.F.Ca.ET.204.01.1.1]TGR18670.1 hypothetical protein EN839_30865 [Mesorhizobium sp. M1C.F.Ca.ET.196.01.1.1]